MIDTWMQTLGEAIRAHAWAAPLLALLAGLLTAFTPCSLSTVPLVIGYVGGGFRYYPMNTLAVPGGISSSVC